MSMTVQELASRIGATVVGDGSRRVVGCAAIEHAASTDVTFLANRKYASHLLTTQAAAVIVDAATQCPDGLTRLIADEPYFAFRNAVIELHGFRQHPDPMDAERWSNDALVSRRASIHPSASIESGACIHPSAIVESGASIGRNTILYPGAYVGVDAHIGDDSILYPNTTVYDRCIVGNRVTLHAGTVIGQDGFGYATYQGRHHKIPQIGIVIIEDDVELGAGCMIERAAIGETRIGAGTKFADLISIGHGTTIGKHCLFVSFVGISGSVQIGDYVVLGGQVGVTGHLRIGNAVQAAARSAIVSDVPDGQRVGGAPAVPFEQARRNAIVGTQLHELLKRVRQLERDARADNP